MSIKILYTDFSKNNIITELSKDLLLWSKGDQIKYNILFQKGGVTEGYEIFYNLIYLLL
jgi:hypothetical protein